jgi:uncharacterized protein YjiS (DUF1127 family)
MARTPTASRGIGPTIADALPVLRRKLVETLKEWHRRANSRRDLLRLSGRDLWDLRLTRADAEREASKPFWQE